MSNTSNVTSAKPKAGGAVHTAVLGTPLPTNATAKLNAAFKGLGFISDDGLTNENTMETESIKAWGGQVVNSVQTEKTDTFTYKLLEALNVDVLKEVYGADNVEGTLETGITVKANSKELPEHPLVVDTILKGGALKRIVIPLAKVKTIGEIKYGDAEVLGYELTVDALPDEHENTHYEYIIQKPASSTGRSDV